MAETNITGPLWGYEQRNRRLAGLWSIVASSAYSLSAASSINEGSGLTITVSGSNISDGTYYWTINHVTTVDADFSAVSGSFTITNNSGSFTVTPTADTTTEGAQTFTVSIRSGSISGTVLATTSTETVNDTSTTPIVPTAGYWSGAAETTSPTDQQSTVRRLQFSNETATNRAPLSTKRKEAQTVTNLTYGWVTGGNYLVPATPPTIGWSTVYLTSIERITFASDTTSPSTRGSMLSNRSLGIGKSDMSNYGWLTDGVTGAGINTNIERIIFSSDTSATTVRTNTGEARYYCYGDATDSTTYSWTIGGTSTNITRFTFAADTTIASTRATQPFIYSGAVTYNSNYGWHFGGQGSGVESSTYRITFASDTNSPSTRGNLHQSTCYISGAGNANKAYLGGGQGGFVGAVVTYATDTATATSFSFTDTAYNKSSTVGIM